MVGLNWFDVILILTLGLGLLIGYTQGLLRQVIVLAALYLGAIVGAQYYYVLANGMRNIMTTTPPLLLNSAAFFIIMLAVMAILNLLALDATRMTLTLHPAIDHLGGIVCGLVTTWIVITIAVNLLNVATGVTWPEAENTRQILSQGLRGSTLAAQTAAGMPALLGALKPWLPSGLPSIFSL